MKPLSVGCNMVLMNRPPFPPAFRASVYPPFVYPLPYLFQISQKFFFGSLSEVIVRNKVDMIHWKCFLTRSGKGKTGKLSKLTRSNLVMRIIFPKASHRKPKLGPLVSNFPPQKIEKLFERVRIVLPPYQNPGKLELLHRCEIHSVVLPDI
jgi:hypothetical protein